MFLDKLQKACYIQVKKRRVVKEPLNSEFADEIFFTINVFMQIVFIFINISLIVFNFLLVYFRFETKMSEDKKRDDGMQVDDSDVTVSAQK